jgi:spermidine synthase
VASAEGVIASAASPRGEVLLRRRRDADAADEVIELRVNGVFVMDTVHTSSEVLLAQLSLERLEQPVRVLVGGLGLGFTLRALLQDARVSSVVVAEIEPAVAEWVRAGLVPPAAGVLDDARVCLQVADVAQMVHAAAEDSFDLLLLDVDNGPGQLVHQSNAGLYAGPFLAECARVLAPGGRLAVWSAERSGELEEALGVGFDAVVSERVPVRLQSRNTEYWVARGTMRPLAQR